MKRVEITSTYRCGTLTYTRFGLINLFLWLLWGDFCYMIMIKVMPALVPLMLKQHGASNFLIGILVGSIPSLLNFIINPIISTKSDRTRTRWGRRRPYLLIAPPFVCLFLILLGWSDQIGTFFYHLAWGAHGNPAYCIIALIAIFTVMYQTFDLFIGSIFMYIFADVVPGQFIGRFLALFRMAGMLAGVCFNYFVLPLADVHMPMIFTVIGIIYALSFLGMCFHVKEGEYPPPPTVAPGMIAMVRQYFKDCFSIPFFAVFFLGRGLSDASLVCREMFNILFATNLLHLTLKQFGTIMAVSSLVGVALFLPVGYLVDRFHPLRVYLVGAFLVIVTNLFGFFFVKGYVSFFIVAIMLVIVYVFQDGSTAPMNIKLYPKEKYGQYCSACAMVKALMLIAANAGGGAFIDWLGYRYIYIWDFIFTIFCFALMLWTYFRWKKYGGDEDYTPPTTK